MPRLSRRDLLKYTAAAGGAAALGGLLSACGAARPTATPSAARMTASATPTTASAADFRTPLFIPGDSGLFGLLDMPSTELTFTATTETVALPSGAKTALSVYRTQGNDRTYTNPIIRVKSGDRFATTLANGLPEETIIHWHGLRVEARMDGGPDAAIPAGSTYRYAFPVANRGGTYWYHPHPEGKTARQAYSGLAGLFLVEDDDERALRDALDLRFGVSDLPLVLQDKRFAADGRLLYTGDGPAEQMMGFLGDTPLVNLTARPFLNVGTRLYRLRVLNGANARIYRLAFVRGAQRLAYSVIGTDGGLLDHPYPTTEAFLSPGERLDLLLDLRDAAVGEEIFLTSLAFDPMDNEMAQSGSSIGVMGNMPGMGNMTGPSTASAGQGSALPNGQAFPLLRLAVSERIAYDRPLPQTLARVPPLDVAGAQRRPFTLSQTMMPMQWRINGLTYSPRETPVTVARNTTEIWEFRNEAQSMPHPMHIHGFPFQVLERLNSPAQMQAAATYGNGRAASDLGWKDTVLVWPGETVRVGLDFANAYVGEQRYVMHCHNLEHEDNGMMLNFAVI